MDNNILNKLIVNDKDDKKNKIIKIFNKKTLKIIMIVFLLLIFVLLYINLSNKTFRTDSHNVENTSSNYLNTLEYSKEIERKLEALISQIDGAGKVSVMVSLDGSPELIYVYDEESKTSSNSSGTTTTSSSSPIIINKDNGDSALILKEKLPAVKGVIVVSSGANNISIKLDILRAVSTLLDITTDKISVLKGI